MPRSFQLSLLGTGQGKGFLFGRGVLEKYLDQHKTTPIDNAEQKVARITQWLESLSTTDASEASLEQQFVNAIICDVLGYVIYPTSPGQTASVYSKPSSRITGIRGTPDAALGHFSSADYLFTVVVELKSPGAD
jgi:hypothetical protein